MIIKHKRKTIVPDNVGFMWSPLLYWIPGKNTTEITEEERLSMLNRYNDWCVKYNQTPNKDILKDLESDKERQERCKGILKKEYALAEKNLKCISTLGFTANADLSAMLNVSMLAETYTTTIQFRDFDNNFHTLNLDDLNVLKREIFNARSALLRKKWDYENKLKTEHIETFIF